MPNKEHKNNTKDIHPIRNNIPNDDDNLDGADSWPWGLDKETPGYKLVAIINQKLIEDDISLFQACEMLDISYSALLHLKKGRRTVASMERRTLEKVAEWLDLPYLSVMILAEQITLADFYTSISELKDYISRAIDFIVKDKDWGIFAPAEILDSSRPDLQLYIIWCYEKATQTKLIPSDVDYLTLLKGMEEFRMDNPIRSAGNAI